MRWTRFAVLILVATILQTSLIDIIAVTPSNIKPDLLLILLVFFAIYYNPTEVIITSFIIGFASDIIGQTMGPRIISFGLFGTILADLHHALTIRKMPYQSLTIFTIGFLTAILSHFLTFLKAEQVASNLYTDLLWSPLYSALIGPFLFLPSAGWMRIKMSRFSRH